jgi:hypothetical protein
MLRNAWRVLLASDALAERRWSGPGILSRMTAGVAQQREGDPRFTNARQYVLTLTTNVARA